MRVLAIDAGLTCGYAALGGNMKVVSGSRELRRDGDNRGVTARHFDQILRSLICDQKPTVIAFATPFVGSIRGKPFILNGRKIWPSARPVDPKALRPLMGIIWHIEAVADELHLRCTEWDESTARRAFLTKVPRKSKDIKAAVIRACRQRGWPACDDHAADALVIASYVLEVLEPHSAHLTTPLFQGESHAMDKRDARRIGKPVVRKTKAP
jgi:hypothetical protein